MKPADIAPYFHPTQVVLVDDDIDFLGNLSLQLDSDLAYLLFDSTSKALHYLDAHGNRRTSRERFFQRSSEVLDKNPSATLQIDCAEIQREMRSSERFAQVSVVLVDYAMPGMDGLEFCRRIDDPHIKKILFTGVATESVAVDAFNKGIIDQYIRKQERSVYTTLNEAIRKFQRQYIRDLFVAAADIFTMETPTLLSDPAVNPLLATLKREHDLLEYYLADDPPGFLFADADGNVKRAVMLDQAARQSEARRLAALGMSADGVAAVAAGELICDPAIDASDIGNWRQRALVARESIDAYSSRLWAIFPINDPITGKARPSYNEFLGWLDTVGYALM